MRDLHHHSIGDASLRQGNKGFEYESAGREDEGCRERRKGWVVPPSCARSRRGSAGCSWCTVGEWTRSTHRAVSTSLMKLPGQLATGNAVLLCQPFVSAGQPPHIEEHIPKIVFVYLFKVRHLLTSLSRSLIRLRKSENLTRNLQIFFDFFAARRQAFSHLLE